MSFTHFAFFPLLIPNSLILFCINSPTFIQAAAHEKVVDADAAFVLFDQIPARVKLLKTYDNCYHDLVHEPERMAVLRDMCEFIAGVAQAPLALRQTVGGRVARVISFKNHRQRDGVLMAEVADQFVEFVPFLRDVVDGCS